jgi:putative DNA primase/helicase
MCVKDGLGESGFEIWDEWGSQGGTHKASSAKSSWKSFKDDGKLTIASLFYDAKQAGWKDTTTYKKPTKAEIEARKAASAARAAKAQAEDDARHAAAAIRAQEIWDAAKPATDHPYLTRKGVLAHGLRVGKWERIDPDTGEFITVTDNGLILPLRDRTRKLWSLQCIHPDPDHNKIYLRDGAKRGNFFSIGSKPLQRDGQNVFVLVEGYATGASVHECTGDMVIVCFDTGGLLPVAKLLRERQPDAVIIFAADNDTETEGNPGVRAARKAALEVGGLLAVPPSGDFNDLHQSEGTDAAVEALYGATRPVAESETMNNKVEAVEGVVASRVLALQDACTNSIIKAEDAEVIPASHFTVLGHNKGTYYAYQHRLRQICTFNAKEIGTESTMLMLATSNFWGMYLPKPDGKPGLNKHGFADWFFRLAEVRGVFDVSKIRGRGAWKDEDRLIFHRGDSLTINGQPFALAEVTSKFMYQAAVPLPMGSDCFLSDGEGHKLFLTLTKANWVNPASAFFLAGWTFLAPICGALTWRPHIWVTGAAGCGKSTLLNAFAGTLLKDIGYFLGAGSTEAGIRQMLHVDALPVLLDEFETNDDKDQQRISAVMTTIRSASSEGATRTVRGSAGGQAMQFDVRSMFCLASINTALDKTSDSSRITVLALRSTDNVGENTCAKEFLDELHQVQKLSSTLSSLLLRRAEILLPITLQNIAIFTAATTRHLKSARHGDQFGALLAGMWGLSFSKLVSAERADEVVKGIVWDDFLQQAEVSDATMCLTEIMNIKIIHFGATYRVCTMVAIAAGALSGREYPEPQVAKRMLNDLGLTITKGKYFAIAYKSASLTHALRETRFNSDWSGQIMRIPECKHLDSTSFGPRPKARAYGIPLEILQLDSNDEDRPI